MQLERNRTKTFEDAARHYLATEAKKSLDRDRIDLEMLVPWIGHLELGLIKRPMLVPYVEHMLRKGLARATVHRSLKTAKRVLVLACDEWEWIGRVPMLRTTAILNRAAVDAEVAWKPAVQGYVLSREEQRRLVTLLPKHLQPMVLFAIHTAARQEEVCGLRWDWLRQGEVWHFDLPANTTKAARRRPLVLNRSARRIIEDMDDGRQYVFTLQGSRVLRMNNTGWRRARVKAKMPWLRVHDLRHTGASRMHDAGADLETVAAVLGHSVMPITQLYAAPSLRRMYEAAESPYESTALVANL